MKKTTYLCLTLAALFTCSCSSDNSVTNDEKEIKNDITLTLNASLGNSSSSAKSSAAQTRITTNSDNGLTTLWTGGTDVLNVYNMYGGTSYTAQNFTNSAAASSVGTFVKTTASAAFTTTPGSNYVYAFNQLETPANYTVTPTTTPRVFTLTEAGLNSQSGLVADLCKHDAMFGNTTATSGTLAGDMTMQHLNAVLVFKLQNTDFSTSLSSIELDGGWQGGDRLACPILPSTAGTGSFTLQSDTIVNYNLTSLEAKKNMPLTGTIPVVSGIAPVYVMTFPYKNATGGIRIMARNGTDLGGINKVYNASGSIYYGRYLAFSNYSLYCGKARENTVTLNKNNYYKWDSTDAYPTVENTATTGVATNSCKNCPTYNQASWYIKGGWFWDNTKVWKDCYGEPHTGGIWLKKKQTLINDGTVASEDAFNNTSASGVSGVSPLGTASQPSASDRDANWFFLPATGFYRDGVLYNEGNGVDYWLSSPTNTTLYGYMLATTSLSAGLRNTETTGAQRYCGRRLWTVQ
jgi:hypothetical protein